MVVFLCVWGGDEGRRLSLRFLFFETRSLSSSFARSSGDETVRSSHAFFKTGSSSPASLRVPAVGT